MDQYSTIWIKDEWTDAVPDELGSMVQPYPSTMNVKEEMEDDVNKELLEDPSSVVEAVLHVKQEPELESSECNVVASTSYASTSYASTSYPSTSYESDTTRLIQNRRENCDILFEETVKEEVVHDELNNTAEDSTHFTMFSTGTQEMSSQENNLFGNRIKCNARENKFHKFSCSSCLESFPSKYKLIMHVFIHIDGVQPPVFVCESCGEVFPNNFNLNKHLESDPSLCTGYSKDFNCREGHKNVSFFEDDLEVTFMEQTERQSTSLKSCVEKIDRGDTYLTSPTSVNVNACSVALTSETPHKCNFCGRSFSRSNHLKSHVSLHLGKRPHKCEVCCKSFARSYHLKLHALTHTGTKPHKCEFCDRSFTQLGALKSHVLLHTGNRPYKCDVCSKTFVQVGLLRSHALLHTGNTPYKCKICGQSFVTLCRFNNHMSIHTGIRKYKCDICGKCYNQSSTFKRHKLSHTEKKHYNCEICGDYFDQLRYLKFHILKHTGKDQHNCDICGKSFKFLGALKTHALIHTGVRPHKCDVCGKSFTQLGNLKHHVKALHTEKTPYNCEICGKNFPVLLYLKRHTKLHTEKKSQK